MKNLTVLSCLLLSISVVLIGSYMTNASHVRVYSNRRLSPELRMRVDRANSLLKQGSQERRAGDLADAENDLKACLAEDVATNQFARQELAQVYEAEGRTAEAIQVYQTMLHPPANEGNGGTFSQDGFTLIHYANVLNDAGRWPEAVQAYGEILKNPNMPDNQEHPASNEPHLEMSFNPGIPEPVAMKAMLHIALGRRYGHNYKEALPQFEQAVATDPNIAIAHFYRGYALRGQGRLAEANRAFATAGKLDDISVQAAARAQLQPVH